MPVATVICAPTERLTMTMEEKIAECLLFWDDGQAMASVPDARGIRTTHIAQDSACLELLASRSWDCLILSAVGQVDDALALLTESRRTHPEIPVLMLVRHGDTPTAVEAMKAGAAYCLQIPVDEVQLASVVHSICRQANPEPMEGWTRLTPVERTVLGHLLDGCTNQQIADLLCRSHRTIEVHRRHIMTKLRATNIVELVKRSMPLNGVAHIPNGGPPTELSKPGAGSARNESRR